MVLCTGLSVNGVPHLIVTLVLSILLMKFFREIPIPPNFHRNDRFAGHLSIRKQGDLNGLTVFGGCLSIVDNLINATNA